MAHQVYFDRFSTTMFVCRRAPLVNQINVGIFLLLLMLLLLLMTAIVQEKITHFSNFLMIILIISIFWCLKMQFLLYLRHQADFWIIVRQSDDDAALQASFQPSSNGQVHFTNLLILLNLQCSSFQIEYKMITISQDHYNKLLDLIRCLHGNITLIFPSSEYLQTTISAWNQINSQISELYHKISQDLNQIICKNNELMNQNREITQKMGHLRSENSQLGELNMKQRAELTKNMSEINKFKETLKHFKESSRDKMKEKDETILQLTQKVKQYRKVIKDLNRVIEKMDKKIKVIQAIQQSNAKGKELDDQLLLNEELLGQFQEHEQGEITNQFNEQQEQQQEQDVN